MTHAIAFVLFGKTEDAHDEVRRPETPTPTTPPRKGEGSSLPLP